MTIIDNLQQRARDLKIGNSRAENMEFGSIFRRSNFGERITNFVKSVRGDRPGFIQPDELPTSPDLPWESRTRTYGGSMDIPYQIELLANKGMTQKQTADILQDNGVDPEIYKETISDIYRAIHETNKNVASNRQEYERHNSWNPMDITYADLNGYTNKPRGLAIPEHVTPKSSNYVRPQGEQPPDQKTESLQSPIEMVEILGGLEQPEL